jgi:hypothetical protein
MYSLRDYAAAKTHYADLTLPPIKIVLTGSGRVGQGAALVLEDMGVVRVSPKSFLTNEFDHAVYCHLGSQEYVKRKDGLPFSKQNFYAYPSEYESNLEPYTHVGDIMINGIFWDNEAPAFFTAEQMAHPAFKIQVIADVTCDIAPISSIPSTLRASTIIEPIFGYHPISGKEVDPFRPDAIDVMSIDNLPNEMARDASEAFGKQFIKYVIPEFLKEDSQTLDRATVVQNGDLGSHFSYLRSYAGLMDSQLSEI